MIYEQSSIHIMLVMNLISFHVIYHAHSLSLLTVIKSIDEENICKAAIFILHYTEERLKQNYLCFEHILPHIIPES
jgi:hypothetical protein